MSSIFYCSQLDIDNEVEISHEEESTTPPASQHSSSPRTDFSPTNSSSSSSTQSSNLERPSSRDPLDVISRFDEFYVDSDCESLQTVSSTKSHETAITISGSVKILSRRYSDDLLEEVSFNDSSKNDKTLANDCLISSPECDLSPIGLCSEQSFNSVVQNLSINDVTITPNGYTQNRSPDYSTIEIISSEGSPEINNSLSHISATDDDILEFPSNPSPENSERLSRIGEVSSEEKRLLDGYHKMRRLQRFTCHFCDRLFKSHESLVSHYEVHGVSYCATRDPWIEERLNEGPEEDEEIINCEDHSSEEFTCEVCDMIFATSEGLSKHMVVHRLSTKTFPIRDYTPTDTVSEEEHIVIDLTEDNMEVGADPLPDVIIIDDIIETLNGSTIQSSDSDLANSSSYTTSGLSDTEEKPEEEEKSSPNTQDQGGKISFMQMLGLGQRKLNDAPTKKAKECLLSNRKLYSANQVATAPGRITMCMKRKARLLDKSECEDADEAEEEITESSPSETPETGCSPAVTPAKVTQKRKSGSTGRKQRRFPCKVCKGRFTSKDTLDRHMKTHWEVYYKMEAILQPAIAGILYREIASAICECTFCHTESREKNKELHNFTCQVCHSTFLTGNKLSKHMDKHRELYNKMKKLQEDPKFFEKPAPQPADDNQ